MEKYCYNCIVSIEANDEYLHCFRCNALYCNKCIESNQFFFDEDILLYKYNCNHCIKIKNL